MQSFCTHHDSLTTVRHCPKVYSPTFTVPDMELCREIRWVKEQPCLQGTSLKKTKKLKRLGCKLPGLAALLKLSPLLVLYLREDCSGSWKSSPSDPKLKSNYKRRSVNESSPLVLSMSNTINSSTHTFLYNMYVGNKVSMKQMCKVRSLYCAYSVCI